MSIVKRLEDLERKVSGIVGIIGNDCGEDAELIKNSSYHVKEKFIDMNQGEKYAGRILDDDGQQSHDLIFVKVHKYKADYEQAILWARSEGLQIPTPRELELLSANLRDEFYGEWHWSCDNDESIPFFAFSKNFSNGELTSRMKTNMFRAIGVRRVMVQP